MNYVRKVGMEKKPLIILTGPTSVGKSALSIKLAKAVDGEIISANSCRFIAIWILVRLRLSQIRCRGSPLSN